MDFIYYYKTPDGLRHEAEMAAPSREEVFAALRARGIRPIKVVAKEAPPARGGVRKRVLAVVVVAVAALAGIVGAVVARQTQRRGADTGTADGISSAAVSRPATGRLSVAQPLARQRIPGNRERIEQIPTNLFAHAAEAFLARFAEPGRRVADGALTPAVEADFPLALKESLMVSSDEFSEYIDLKRMVAGMKRELRAYLAGGGTVRDYVAELVKRQKMEQAYREKAEAHLKKLLTPAETAGEGRTTAVSAAYAYWLKANASLQSMGIAPLALPDDLRAYQLSLDIDDAEGVPTLEAGAR